MSSFVGFLSGSDQFGRWVPEPEITASAYLGGSTVDFSQALFQHPVITISSTAFWGSVTVIVPPNVAVEQDGTAILGGFGDAGGVWSSTGRAAAAKAPVTIRIVGTALMGRVNAVVNHTAAPAQLLSPEEVQRVLREVPPEPSTTQRDLLAQALQAEQARRAADQAATHALAQAILTGAGAAAGAHGAHGAVPTPVPADPRAALLQGLAAAHPEDTRAAVLQALAAHAAPAPAPVAQTQAVLAPSAPALSQTSPGNNLSSMD